MSSSNTETQIEAPAAKAVVQKQKKLKPARKQVKPGDVDKQTAPQTGKEYSARPTWSYCQQQIALTSHDRHMVQQVGWR